MTTAQEQTQDGRSRRLGRAALPMADRHERPQVHAAGVGDDPLPGGRSTAPHPGHIDRL